MKEIEDNTNKWKDIPSSWIGRINIVKMDILPKVIYRLSAILIQIPRAFFTELEQIICTETQKTPIAKSILGKKRKVGGIILPGFKLKYSFESSKQYCTGTKTDS